MIRNFSSTETNEEIQILLVEDDSIFAINLKEILEYWKYTVIDTANSAELAIEKANKFRPDLILMDIKLSSEMNGIQAAEKIWDTLKIPSIYITGYADITVLEKATQRYPFAYLIKPITLQELSATIQKLLGKMFEEER